MSYMEGLSMTDEWTGLRNRWGDPVQGRHNSHVRLRLTTSDLAVLFKVTEETMRSWLANRADRTCKLPLTGNPTQDFKTIVELWSEQQRATREDTTYTK